MDRVIIYKYAFEGIERLTSEETEGLDLADRFEDLELSRGGLILVPRFVGVYQDVIFKPDSKKEKEDLGDYRGILSSMNKMLELSSRFALE